MHPWTLTLTWFASQFHGMGFIGSRGCVIGGIICLLALGAVIGGSVMIAAGTGSYAEVRATEPGVAPRTALFFPTRPPLRVHLTFLSRFDPAVTPCDPRSPRVPPSPDRPMV